MRADRRLAALGLLVSAMVIGGCRVDGALLDAPGAVRLHVSTTPTTVEIDAPGWLADTSAVYLCASAPPTLPDEAADRIGWVPGGDCHDFGRHASSEGLTISLPLSALQGASRTAFEAAPDWYLLLLDVDGDRVSTAVRSQFRAPDVAPS